MSQRLLTELKEARAELDGTRNQLAKLGALGHLQLEKRRRELEREVEDQKLRLQREQVEAMAALEGIRHEARRAQERIVATEDLEMLQEVGIYRYQHPLTDVVAYQNALESLESSIKMMVKKDGGAILATTSWQVNGSASEGRAMVRDFSKLMLRAFNAEADNLVRTLKPYKLNSALDRLKKVADVIERLGKTMSIKVAPAYLQLRVQELELTADYLQKEAEAKETERLEKERLKEERKVQQEIERERELLEKERQHYANALNVLVTKGDAVAASRMREQLAEVERNIESVDYRAANIRAGYVYVISNIGSFGERMVKVGLTRRLDPMERIRELSDASVPFNFDVHALHFSNDAVSIEAKLHELLASARVNAVNHRREFFHATPTQIKGLLGKLAGELLEFKEIPEALEYRQSMKTREQAQGLILAPVA
jgi:hypothetical protein